MQTIATKPAPIRRSPLRRWSRRLLFTFTVALIAIEIAGCSLTGTLANQVVRCPNAGRRIDPAGDPSPDELRSSGVTRQFRVQAGPPDASLLVWVIDPPAPALVNAVPKGTIVCLHGHAADRRQMLGPAQAFAAAGYRAVLFDSRCNGRSSGDYLTFGVVESRDARQVLDALVSNGFVSGQVGAFGRSYGGATAIQWAAIDPRVRTVVAVSSFATMRNAVHDASKAILPFPLHLLLDWRIDPIVDRAGQQAGFDPDAASPLRAITQTDIPILLMHGSSDGYISSGNSQRLHDAAPGHSKLVLVEGKGHNSIMEGDSATRVLREAVEWFDQRLDILPAPGETAVKGQ